MKRGLVFSVILVGLMMFSFFVTAADTTEPAATATGTAAAAGTGTGGATATNSGAGTTADILTPPAEPEGFSEQRSIRWLNDTMMTSEGGTIQEQALTILALNNKGFNVAPYVAKLQLDEDNETGCFPAYGCKTEDSAFGLVALEKTGQDVSKEKDYLLNQNSQTAGLKQGEWRLQLDVAGNGSCLITFGDNNKTKAFSVDNGVIKPAAGKYYIDIKDLDPSLISTKVSQPLSIDCKDMTGTASLVYYLRASNSYFLLDSQTFSAGIANLKITNACFRASTTGDCNLGATLYATWALTEAGEPLGIIGTLPYLESSIITSTPTDLQKALLVRILQKSGNSNVYFDNLLLSSQKNGAWGSGDIYATSWGLFALEKAGTYTDAVTAATAYLQKRNLGDGSWSNVLNTAMALIALNGGELAKTNIKPATGGAGGGGTGTGGTTTPGEVNALGGGSATQAHEDICEGNFKDNLGFTGCSAHECVDYPKCLCDNGQKDEGEDDVDCGGSCISCEDKGNVQPNIQGGCTSDEECGSEEKCSDGQCVQSIAGPVQITKPKTTTTTSSSSWIWIGLIILIVLAGGGGVFYLKSQGKLDGLFKSKPKGPSFTDFKRQMEMKPAAIQPKPGTMPFKPMARPAAPLRNSGQDDELERSLKEAEKLLKGK